MSYVYLSSPYTGADAETMQRRYDAACLFTAMHMRAGVLLFSPIVHCHELSINYSLPKNFAFWRKWCLGMLSPASELWLLRLDGWEDSKGCREEMDFWTQQLGKHVVFHDPM